MRRFDITHDPNWQPRPLVQPVALDVSPVTLGPDHDKCYDEAYRRHVEANTTLHQWDTTHDKRKSPWEIDNQRLDRIEAEKAQLATALHERVDKIEETNRVNQQSVAMLANSVERLMDVVMKVKQRTEANGREK